MRNFFSSPFIVSPGKFLARVSYGALWGVLLSDAVQDVRIMFALMLGPVALFLSTAFVAWDRTRVADQTPGQLASRMALHGLFVVGEVLCVGAVVLMALGAFQANPNWAYAAAIAAFSGYLASVYALFSLVKRNIAERRGSKQ